MQLELAEKAVAVGRAEAEAAELAHTAETRVLAAALSRAEQGSEVASRSWSRGSRGG